MTNVSTLNTPPTPAAEVSLVGRVLLTGVSWETFKALMADLGEDRACRIAYDGGLLEIRMPLIEHEEPKILIASFIETLADELEIEIRQLGALTLKREDLSRAIEPDTCFYIQNEARVRGKSIELPNDPPPDLVLESDYTNSSLNKFTIYASLGVPELWRYRRKTLEVYQLVEGEYKLGDRSLAFPFLPLTEVPNFIEQSPTIGQRSAVRLFRARMREILSGNTN
jgi:Uma2 family endonuclease